MFENTFAIAEFTFCIGKGFYFLGFYVDGLHFMQYIFQLCPVCPYILYGPCTNRTRNKRKILYSAIIIIYTMDYKTVPSFSRIRLNINSISFFFNCTNSFKNIPNYNSFIIAGG